MKSSSVRWSALLSALIVVACAQAPSLPAAVQNQHFKPPPGAVDTTVTQASVRRTICKPGWAAHVRPPASFLRHAKVRLMKQYAVPSTDANNYEVDFLIPLSLGGHPRRHDNLWLQPNDGPWDAGTKDRLEAKLQHMVCSGEITLREAREAVRADWKLAARYYLSDRELLTPLR